MAVVVLPTPPLPLSTARTMGDERETRWIKARVEGKDLYYNTFSGYRTTETLAFLPHLPPFPLV